MIKEQWKIQKCCNYGRKDIEPVFTNNTYMQMQQGVYHCKQRERRVGVFDQIPKRIMVNSLM